MRPDGKRILAENPLYNLMPYVLTKRYDAMNMVTLDIPEAPLRAYMNAKRAEKQPMSHLALLLTAYLRAVEKYPALNRFISGNHKIYQRNNISVAMVVLRPGGGSTMSKIILNEGDTVFDVQRKITDYVDTNRQGGGEQSGQAETNGLDKLVNFLLHTGPLLNILMWALRFADRHGLLPRAITDASPFHASLLVSNLASIRCNHIYHHVYEFGATVSGQERPAGRSFHSLREEGRPCCGSIALRRRAGSWTRCARSTRARSRKMSAVPWTECSGRKAGR